MITVSPIGSNNILSKPFGPNVVLTISANELQASAFYFNTSMPDEASPAKNNDYYCKLLLI